MDFEPIATLIRTGMKTNMSLATYNRGTSCFAYVYMVLAHINLSIDASVYKTSINKNVMIEVLICARRSERSDIILHTPMRVLVLNIKAIVTLMFTYSTFVGCRLIVFLVTYFQLRFDKLYL